MPASRRRRPRAAFQNWFLTFRLALSSLDLGHGRSPSRLAGHNLCSPKTPEQKQTVGKIGPMELRLFCLET